MSNQQFLQGVNAILKWPDRRKVLQQIESLPIPYALAFLRVNTSDIDFWRLVAKANMEMNDDIVKAIFAFGIKGDRTKRISFPKKKKKGEDVAPAPFRENDKYWRQIMDNDISVTNQARHMGDALPQGIGKRPRRVVEWL